jgi:hypothetical protein
VWTGFTWLRIGSINRDLWTQYDPSGFIQAANILTSCYALFKQESAPICQVMLGLSLLIIEPMSLTMFWNTLCINLVIHSRAKCSFVVTQYFSCTPMLRLPPPPPAFRDHRTWYKSTGSSLWSVIPITTILVLLLQCWNYVTFLLNVCLYFSLKFTKIW